VKKGSIRGKKNKRGLVLAHTVGKELDLGLFLEKGGSGEGRGGPCIIVRRKSKGGKRKGKREINTHNLKRVNGNPAFGMNRKTPRESANRRAIVQEGVGESFSSGGRGVALRPLRQSAN